MEHDFVLCSTPPLTGTWTLFKSEPQQPNCKKWVYSVMTTETTETTDQSIGMTSILFLKSWAWKEMKIKSVGVYFCFFRILLVFIEYFLDVTKTPILMWHINPGLQPGGSGVGLSPLQSRLQSDKCDIFSCNSVRSILCEIWDACLDQVVAGCHRGYDIWYNRLTKLLRGEGGEGRGEVRAQVDCGATGSFLL